MTILETIDLKVAFGNLVAVNDVSLSFEKGKIIAIIGPNGAGKSTFFNLISGKLKPTSGQVFFLNNKITGMPPIYFLK